MHVASSKIGLKEFIETSKEMIFQRYMDFYSVNVSFVYYNII